MQVPCGVVPVGDRYPRIVGHDLVVYSLDSFCVRLHPSNLWKESEKNHLQSQRKQPICLKECQTYAFQCTLLKREAKRKQIKKLFTFSFTILNLALERLRSNIVEKKSNLKIYLKNMVYTQNIEILVNTI